MEILKVSREQEKLVSIVFTDIDIETRWLGNYLRDSLIEFSMGDLEVEGPEERGRLFILTFNLNRATEIESATTENIFVIIGRLLVSAEIIVQKKVFDYLNNSQDYSNKMKNALKYYLSYN